MDSGKPFNWIRCIGVVCMVICLLGCPSGQEETKQINLTTAPDFSLKTIDGEDIRLNSFRGKKFVHLTFWATWCPACLMEIPKLKKLYQAVGDKPFEILSISVGVNDSIKKVRKVQEQKQLPYKILFDESGMVSQQYGIMGIPTHIVIDKDGKVIARFNQLPENPNDYFSQFFPS
jgi:peroxiredoxin